MFDATPRAETIARADDARPIRCARCGTPITSADAAITSAGQHILTFANPAGYVHRIRLFASATNVLGVGRPTQEATWFPGLAWQIVVCAGCGVHVGWRYHGDGGFHGLLEAALADG